MGLSQLNFAGLDKVQVAIMRIKEYEPPDGYFLAFSGGKDSIVLYDLAQRSDVKFDAHYQATGIDPPELVQFIRINYPSVIRHKPTINLFKEIIKRGLPLRQRRWCCEFLKEVGGQGRVVLTGIRWAESSRRRNRQMVEVSKAGRFRAKLFVHPIIDWADSEIWEYIRIANLAYCGLYDEGFKRLGCVLCPMTSSAHTLKEMQRWPKLANAWKAVTIRLWERRKAEGNPAADRWQSGEDMFTWWITRGDKHKEPDCRMFDN